MLDPVPGYHETPVVTLDYASLYPSIMIQDNVCYTTHVPAGVALQSVGLDEGDVNVIEGSRFVKRAQDGQRAITDFLGGGGRGGSTAPPPAKKRATPVAASAPAAPRKPASGRPMNLLALMQQHG